MELRALRSQALADFPTLPLRRRCASANIQWSLCIFAYLVTSITALTTLSEATTQATEVSEKNEAAGTFLRPTRNTGFAVFVNTFSDTQPLAQHSRQLAPAKATAHRPKTGHLQPPPA